MPAPSSTTFNRPDLGMSFEEWDDMAAAVGYVGLQLLPPVEVGLQAANFSVVPREAFTKTREVKRAPGAAYNRQDWEFEQVSYSTVEKGAEDLVDDRQRNMFAYTGLRLEQLAARRATLAILRNIEETIEGLLFNTSNFTANNVGTEWNNSGTPIADVMDAANSFKNQCGMLPDTIVFSDKVLRNLQSNSSIVDRIKYNGAGGEDARRVTIAALQEIWSAAGIQRVLVPMGPSNVTDSADEGQAFSGTDLWDDEYAFLCRTSPGRMDPMGPGLGVTFHYVGDGSSLGPTVEMYREERVRADIVRARLDVHEKLIDTACGYLMGNITT